MKSQVLASGKFILCLFFSVFMGWGAQAQTCSQGSPLIVGGTEFEAGKNINKEYRTINEIAMIGPAGGTIGTTLPFSNNPADFDGTKRVYTIVDNPSKVNPSFMNIDDPMILMCLTGLGGNAPYLYFQVEDLKPASQYTVTVEGYFVQNGTTCSVPGTTTSELWFVHSTDATSNFSTYSDGINVTSYRWQKKFSYTTPVHNALTLGPGRNGLFFHFRHAGSSWSNCIILGITKIEIKGCADPKVTSGMVEGSEVCIGDPMRLVLDREYDATTYYWEKSTVGAGGPWTPFGGNNKSALDEATESNNWYRCTVDGTESKVYKVTTIMCCPEKEGSSRQKVYHDNFGTFLGPRSYLDMWGNPYPTRSIDWRVYLPYTVPNHIWDDKQWWPGDGYCVVTTSRGVSTNYGGTQGLGVGLTADASGDPNGGVMFINIANDIPGAATAGAVLATPFPIYSYQIDNLCTDIDIYFETSVANAGDATSQPPSIIITVEKTNGEILGSASTGVGTANILRGAPSHWERLTIPPFSLSPADGTSVILKVATLTNGGTGWDLFMDDIIFRICTPPIVEVYSDIKTLTQDATICDRYKVNLATQLSESVYKYYQPYGAKFLYQMSKDGNVWENISGIEPDSIYSYPLSDAMGRLGLDMGDDVYFRIIVASEDILDLFDKDPNVQGNTLCKTASISKPIKIHIDCPCPAPNKVTIGSVEKSIINKNILVCQNETFTLNVNPVLSPYCEAAWFQSTTRPAPGATPLYTGSTVTLTANAVGTTTQYFVKVYETEAPNFSSCWRFDSIFVTVDKAPAISNDLTDCYNYPTDCIRFQFKSNYADGTLTGTPQASRFIPYKTKNGNDRIGTETIKVLAGDDSFIERCYQGTQVEVEKIGTDTFFHVYLQEASLSGTLGENATQVTSGTVNSNAFNSLWYGVTITVIEPIIIESLQAVLVNNTNQNRTLTVTPRLYSISGTTATLELSGASTPVSFTGRQEVSRILPFDANNTVLPGTYILALTATGGDAGNILVRYHNNYPNDWDNTGENILQRIDSKSLNPTSLAIATIAAPATNYNPFFNIKFRTFSTDCSRVKLTVRQDCPVCTKPVISGTTKVCAGSTTSLSISNSAAAGSGSWFSRNTAVAEVSSSGVVTGKLAGETYIRFRTDEGCVDSVNVTVNSLPTVTVNNPSFCVGLSAILTADGATDYTWSPSTGLSATTGNNITANPPSTAIYTVEGTDTNGCKNTATATVTVNLLPTPVITKSPDTSTLTCTNQSITLTASGGISYLWNATANNETTAVVTTTGTGTYEVEVTDVNGCKAKTNVIITEEKTPPAVSINSPATTELTCDIKDIDLTAFSSDSGTFSWTNSGGGVVGSSATLNVTEPGRYTVTMTGSANGCTNTTFLDITQSDEMPAVSVTPNNAELTCSLQTITLTALATDGAGGYTYSWNTGTNTNAIDVTTPATYTVTVEDANGCKANASATITQNIQKPIAGITKDTEGNQLTCSLTAINLTATGGGTYSWNDVSTNAQLRVTEPDLYTVTVIGANGCTKDTTIQITQDIAEPNAGITNVTGKTELTCSVTEIKLLATGGVDYSWNNSLGTNAEVTVEALGIYTVTVIGANGCTKDATIQITQDIAEPNAGITNVTGKTELTCLITKIELLATGGVAYSWNNSLGTNAEVTVEALGIYTVTVIGVNGCTKDTTIQITQDVTLPDAKITNKTNATELTCSITKIELTASGGDSYLWSNGLGINPDLEVAAPAIYTVTVTGANGCTATDFIEINQSNETPTLDITPSATTLTCDLTSITLTANATGGNGNYTYSWGASADTTVTNPGIYTAKVTDGNGCSITANITIGEDITLPTVTITNNTNATELTCDIESISLTATGGKSYLWKNLNGDELAMIANLTVKLPDTYTVTATGDNGCKNTAVEVITISNDRPTVIITPSSGTLTCETTNIKLTASATGGDGDYTFSWANAEMIVTTIGTYDVTVIDGKGCEATTSIKIDDDKSLPTVSIITNPATNVLTCETTTIRLTATGGDSYVWDNALGNSNFIDVSNEGYYAVTAKKASNGCTAKKDITINSDESLPTIVITTNPAINVLTCTTLSITLTATGGSSYLWSNGLQGNSISVDKADTYTVTGTAGNGCSNTQSIIITADKSSPIITVNTPEICLGDEAIIMAKGADSYIWTTGETGASITVSPTAQTSYTVEGTLTKTGCKSTATTTVYIETPLILTLASNPESVELGNEVTITVSADGPSHGDYEWFINNVFYNSTVENYITYEPAAGKQLYRVETRTSYLNCFASSEVFSLTVNESIPNIINPYNPSGINCCFMMSNEVRSGYSVEIYNRYSQKVFEGDNGWDGTYRGAPADPGTYFYRIFMKDGSVKKGTLEVVKF